MATTEIEPVDVPTTRSLVIAGNTPEDILRNAGTVAASLRDLIEQQDLAVSVGRGGKHVEVGGWQAAGSMLGALGGTPLHAETVWSRRADREGLIVYESRCEIRTLAGEIVGAAESLCSSQERNWSHSDEYAVKGMAETRAESRAWRRAIGWVIKLAGYNPTPAEEIGSEPPRPDRAYGEAANRSEEDGLLRALTDLGAGPAVANRIFSRAGYMPRIAALAVMYTAVEAVDKKGEETTASETASEGGGPGYEAQQHEAATEAASEEAT